MEPDYDEMFKPYSLDLKFNGPEEEFKEKVKFVIDNANDAFNLLQSVYDVTYGSIYVNENLVSIHTGGWSENESIIYEFKKTFWWTSNFKIKAAGGHYFFDTTRKGPKEWKITEQPF